MRLFAIRAAEPDRFERAALRWLARFAAERARSVTDVREAAAALAAIPFTRGALLTLQTLCR